MEYKELLINKDKVVMASVDLAIVVGDLEEAVVLNQISYWLERYKELGHNFKDGKYWVYNSYQKWHEDNFPFWHPSKIQRIFKSLETKGLLLSANYNKAGFDKTKWYTIDYQKLQTMINEYEESRRLIKNENSLIESETSLLENEQSLLINEKPIPEDTTEDTNKRIHTEGTSDYYIGTKQSLRTAEPVFDFAIVEKQIKKTLKRIGYESDKELADNIIVVFRYYYDKYYRKFGQAHMILSDKAMQGTIMRYIEGTDVAVDLQYNADSYKTMIDRHFERQYVREIDYSICHFMTEGLRNCLYYEVLY